MSGSSAVAIKNLSIQALYPPHPILSNVSGYLTKGGIMAVIGADGAGKSLLLSTLSGRVHTLNISGHVLVDGAYLERKTAKKSVGFVSHCDNYIDGDLTPQEILCYAGSMKGDESMDTIQSKASGLLASFGLRGVQHTKVRPILGHHLSDGQRKILSICIEIMAAPPVLFLDEPTSGLDGSTSYEILWQLRNIVNNSANRLSIMLSISQTSARILDLFDNVLVLGGGGMLFFGTVHEASEHLHNLGFHATKDYTPTDYFLHLSEKFGHSYDNIDLEGAFLCSRFYGKLMNSLEGMVINTYFATVANKKYKSRSLRNSTHEEINNINEELSSYVHVCGRHGKPSVVRQYLSLLHRSFLLAVRDPLAQMSQLILGIGFGFLVGAVFLKLDHTINVTIYELEASILWVIMFISFIPVFRVYHMHKFYFKFYHEQANNSYSVLTAWLSELFTSLLFAFCLVPGGIFAHFLVGYPSASIGRAIVIYWLAAWGGDSLLMLIAGFLTHDISMSYALSQTSLMILSVYNGGYFISWNRTPSYWQWLQEISYFTQVSRALFIEVMTHSNDFECKLATDTIGTISSSICKGLQGEIFQCNVGTTGSDNSSSSYNNNINMLSNFNVTGMCMVSGKEILKVRQGVSMNDSSDVYIGYTILLIFVIRLCILFLMYVPLPRIKFLLVDKLSAGILRFIAINQEETRHVDKKLKYISLVELNHGNFRQKDVESRLYESVESMADILLKRPESSTQYVSSNSSLSVIHRSVATLTWRHINVTAKGRTMKMLDNVSGIAKSGQVLVLMGPTGAGKSTMINVLSNRVTYGDVTGDVRYCGREVMASDVTFVPCHIELDGNLTVCEHLNIAGRLACCEIDRMKSRMNNLLLHLGLDLEMHVKCKYLSSANLKKLGIALGMVTDPNILILDEPTTGIDTAAGATVVSRVLELARKTEITVVMTIHQPSAIIFEMCQDLFLLESGRMAYFGPVSEAKRFFTNLGHPCPEDLNPADFYMDLILSPPMVDTDITWRDMFISFNSRLILSSKDGAVATTYDNDADLKAPTQFKKFYILLSYFFNCYLRDVSLYWFRTIVLIAISIYSGTIWYNLHPSTDHLMDYASSLYYLLLTTCFVTSSSTEPISRSNRRMLEYIKHGIAHPGTVILAQFLVSIPFNLIIALICQMIFFWLSNINPNGEVFLYVIFVQCGIMLISEAVSFLAVTIVKNVTFASTICIVFVGQMYMMSGLWVSVVRMPVWIGWIAYITPMMYAYEGYMSMIFQTQSFTIIDSNQFSSSASTTAITTISGEKILEDIFDLKGINSGLMLFLLLMWVLLIRTAHFLFVRFETIQFRKQKSIFKKSYFNNDNNNISIKNTIYAQSSLEIVQDKSSSRKTPKTSGILFSSPISNKVAVQDNNTTKNSSSLTSQSSTNASSAASTNASSAASTTNSNSKTILPSPLMNCSTEILYRLNSNNGNELTKPQEQQQPQPLHSYDSKDEVVPFVQNNSNGQKLIIQQKQVNE